MMKSIKRMVLTGVAIMGMMSFSVPAMAQVCDPSDVDCVEPSATDPGYSVEPSTADTYCEPIPCDQSYDVDIFGSLPVLWPW